MAAKREIEAAAARVAGESAVDQGHEHVRQWKAQDLAKLCRTHKPQKRKAKAQARPKKKQKRVQARQFAVDDMVEVLWEEDGEPSQYLRAKVVARTKYSYEVQWDGSSDRSKGIPEREVRRPLGSD